MIRKMREVDQQMFAGWREYPSVYDMMGKIESVAALAASSLRAALAGEPGRSVVFVFTGCGTSGRSVLALARPPPPYASTCIRVPCCIRVSEHPLCNMRTPVHVLHGLPSPASAPKDALKKCCCRRSMMIVPISPLKYFACQQALHPSQAEPPSLHLCDCPVVCHCAGTAGPAHSLALLQRTRRIAWLCAVQLNRLLAQLRPGATPCFKYRVSGGDEALIVSKELPEDDPHLGASELRDAVAG